MTRRTESAASVILALILGIAGALLLAHWSACEQYEGFCAIGWSTK